MPTGPTPTAPIEVDGSLICTVVSEKPFENEIEESSISQACHAVCPEYKKVLEVEKGTEITVVNAPDMKIYVNLLKVIREHEEPRGERRPWPHSH